MNPRTGEILRDLWSSAQGSSGPSIVGSDADDPDDGQDDDSDDDDNCRFDSDDVFFRDFFFAAILDSPFLIFFGGVTIEEDTLRPLEGLPSDGNRFLIVFAMVQILCGVVFFLRNIH